MYSGAEMHFSDGFDDLFLQDVDYSKEVFNQPDQFLSEAQISSTPEYLFGNSSNQVDKVLSPKPLVDPCYGVLTQYLEKELEKIPQMKESVSESTNMSPQQGNTVPLVSYSQMMFGADAQEPSVLVTVMIKKNPQQEVAPESRISSQIYQCIKDLLERQMKIARFKAKKRNFGKRTYYNDRRMMADRRLRVKGRFISKKVAEEYMAKGGDALLIESATKNIKVNNATPKSKSGKGTAQTERENVEIATRRVIQKLQRKSNLFKISHF